MNKVNKFLEITLINIVITYTLLFLENNQKVIDNIQSRNIIIRLNKVSDKDSLIFLIK